VIAYLDAGSGSMIIGVVAAGAAGVGVAARSAMSRFKRKGKADESVEEATEPAESEVVSETTEETTA
jgi:hypothetical protein